MLTFKACDCFEPITKCAQNIINKNGFSDRIKVIAKRSNELTVGPNDCDLSQRVDLLVAEVFDTELIGEGAIRTYRNAVKDLLTPNALLVPSKARIFAQLAQSKTLFSCHQFNDCIKINEKIIIKSPENSQTCNGSNVLHDIQINQLKPNEDFVLVTKPEVVFEFEFNNLSTLELSDHKVIEFEAMRDISGPLVIFMWWELDMDFESQFVLSCAPFWTYNQSSITSKSIPWRDHWMQSVYYFPAYNKEFNLKATQKLKVEAHRDEYSLWFNQFNDQKCSSKSFPSCCECGLHLFLSRTRLSMINDISRLKTYDKAIEAILQNSKSNSITAIFIGDSSLVPIIAAKYNKIKKVICLATNRQTESFISSFSKANDCQNKIQIINNFEQIEDKSVNLVFGEPYFNSSDLPWDQLHFWYLLNRIPSNILSNEMVVMPHKAVIKAIPIEFDNLWKIRAEVGSNVEGFDLSLYDEMIQKAISLSDATIESQPLWEYPAKAIAQKSQQLFELNFNQSIDDFKVLKSFVKFDMSSNLKNLKTKYISVAFWIDFYLFDDIISSTGPIEPIINANYIVWNKNHKQGVTFLPNIDLLNIEKYLNLSVTFDTINGEINCSFEK